MITEADYKEELEEYYLDNKDNLKKIQLKNITTTLLEDYNSKQVKKDLVDSGVNAEKTTDFIDIIIQNVVNNYEIEVNKFLAIYFFPYITYELLNKKVEYENNYNLEDTEVDEVVEFEYYEKPISLSTFKDVEDMLNNLVVETNKFPYRNNCALIELFKEELEEFTHSFYLNILEDSDLKSYIHDKELFEYDAFETVSILSFYKMADFVYEYIKQIKKLKIEDIFLIYNNKTEKEDFKEFKKRA